MKDNYAGGGGGVGDIKEDATQKAEYMEGARGVEGGGGQTKGEATQKAEHSLILIISILLSYLSTSVFCP